MSIRRSSFIGMVAIAGFVGAAASSGQQGGVLVAGLATMFVGPVFIILLGQFLRGDR